MTHLHMHTPFLELLQASYILVLCVQVNSVILEVSIDLSIALC